MPKTSGFTAWLSRISYVLPLIKTLEFLRCFATIDPNQRSLTIKRARSLKPDRCSIAAATDGYWFGFLVDAAADPSQPPRDSSSRNHPGEP